MDGLQGLFEQFRTGGASFIERAKEEQWAETLFLDFKTAAKNSGPMAPDDLKSLGIALSGFANAEGGLIVWGVLADRQTQDEPDVAKELKPIRKLSVFLSDLLAYSPQLVSPIVVGVIHEPILLPDEPDKGYILTCVPKGEGDPHMCMARSEQRYYCRSGASCIKMEHYMVADRFHRRAKPSLEFFYRFKLGGGREGGFAFDVIVGIRNSGQVLALYPALGLTMSYTCTAAGLDSGSRPGLHKRILDSMRPEPLYHLYAGGLNDPIYPGMDYDVERFRGVFPLEPGDLPGITVNYELYCEGFSDRGELLIPSSELLSLL